MAMTHVMVDLETLGTTADAVILSIGAVGFELDATDIRLDNTFSTIISVDSQIGKRRISESTLAWWMQQSKEAQQIFLTDNIPLSAALHGFRGWLGDTEETCLWSNGADFDLPMLAHAYTQCEMDVPWKFYNTRCYRTLKNLPFGTAYGVLRNGIHHNALDDAIYQARMVQSIFAMIRNKTK